MQYTPEDILDFFSHQDQSIKDIYHYFELNPNFEFPFSSFHKHILDASYHEDHSFHNAYWISIFLNTLIEDGSYTFKVFCSALKSSLMPPSFSFKLFKDDEDKKYPFIGEIFYSQKLDSSFKEENKSLFLKLFLLKFEEINFSIPQIIDLKSTDNAIELLDISKFYDLSALRFLDEPFGKTYKEKNFIHIKIIQDLLPMIKDKQITHIEEYLNNKEYSINSLLDTIIALSSYSHKSNIAFGINQVINDFIQENWKDKIPFDVAHNFYKSSTRLPIPSTIPLVIKETNKDSIIKALNNNPSLDINFALSNINDFYFVNLNKLEFINLFHKKISPFVIDMVIEEQTNNKDVCIYHIPYELIFLELIKLEELNKHKTFNFFEIPNFFNQECIFNNTISSDVGTILLDNKMVVKLPLETSISKEQILNFVIEGYLNIFQKFSTTTQDKAFTTTLNEFHILDKIREHNLKSLLCNEKQETSPIKIKIKKI